MDAFYARASYRWNPYSDFNADYIRFTGNSRFGAWGNHDNGHIWGVGTTISFGGGYNWSVFVEYWNNTTADKYDKAWNAGIGYGHMNLKKPGTFNVDLAFNRVGRNVYFGGAGPENDALHTLDSHNRATGVRFWSAMTDVAVMPNVYLHGEYAFDVNARNSIHGGHDAWTVSLNYVF